ncbi:MAG: DUF1707 domain-containing protein [Actinomycetota bacterium]|nr:DUF1707 domain-containing protein [Actinomycetota bacterium]
MNELPELRASDADRDRTVTLLREHSVEGRLTLDEFSQRMEQAYDARTVGELEQLTHDLPIASSEPGRERKPNRFTVVVFGSSERKGRWRLSRHLAIVVFGNADIDLRQAQLARESPSITAFVLFGNIDIYVPEEIEVDVTGISIFAARGDSGSSRAQRPGTPLVRVRAFALFGNSDVWRVPRSLANAGRREVIKSLRSGRRGTALPPG